MKTFSNTVPLPFWKDSNLCDWVENVLPPPPWKRHNRELSEQNFSCTSFALELGECSSANWNYFWLFPDCSRFQQVCQAWWQLLGQGNISHYLFYSSGWSKNLNNIQQVTGENPIFNTSAQGIHRSMKIPDSEGGERQERLKG